MTQASVALPQNSKKFFVSFFQKRSSFLSFFFEKKNQKAFASLVARHLPRLAAIAGLLLASGARAQTVKLATWNLNWLTLRVAHDPALPSDVQPRLAGDFLRLRAYAGKLDADVVAFQEVDGLDAAARVFDPARYTLITIRQDVVQQVGLAVRHGIKVQRNAELAALDVEPAGAAHRLRHGLDATLLFSGGASLRLLAVHLKTGCHLDPATAGASGACGLLARQIALVAAWANARQAAGEAYALLGDFNRVLDQPEALGSALAADHLLRVTAGQSDPCWDGGAFIDHIFLGGAARAWLVPGSLRVMIYKDASADDRSHLSDHCPLSVRLTPPAKP